MTFVETVTEFRDPSGTLVAECALDRDRDRASAPTRATRRCRRWDDLAEGAGPEPREYGPLTRTDFVRYQGASGDFNPIHHDEEFAQVGGLPDGVLGRACSRPGSSATYCTEWLGADNVRRFAVQFREQVWPGRPPRVHRRRSRASTRTDGERKVDVDLLVHAQASGGAAIKGEATFVVPDRGPG